MNPVNKLYLIETVPAACNQFDMANLFCRTKVLWLEALSFEFLLSTLRSGINRVFRKSTPVCVVCIGSKGSQLLELISNELKIVAACHVDAHRVFHGDSEELLSHSAVELNGCTGVKPLSGFPILLVDDVVYSGDTLSKIIELLGIDNEHLFVASLFSFVPILGHLKLVFLGFTAPREKLWPLGSVELIDMPDLFDACALRFSTGRSCSLIDCETLMSKVLTDYGYSI